jgi:hypothetical protein
VHRSFKFSLLTVAGRATREPAAAFAFFLHDAADIEAYSFSMTPEEILLLNPNTGTCPVFRSRRDAEITLGIYKRVPVLVNENVADGNPWGISFMTMFHMSNDAHLFHTREGLEADGWTLRSNIFTRGTDRMLPLYEGRMGHQFNSAEAQFFGRGDNNIEEVGRVYADTAPLPRNWVDEPETRQRLQRRTFACQSGLLGHRRVARSTDERTSIAAILPWGAASYGWIVSSGPDALSLVELCAAYNSFVFDYCLRNALSQPSIPQGVSEQIPCIAPELLLKQCRWDSSADYGAWVSIRSIELSYVRSELDAFARDLGDPGPPFRWDPERRALLRAELDAAFFHIYGVNREDTDYILDTFPIVKRTNEAAYGEYRTKRLILEVYDKMSAAIATGEPYQTILDPPPGQGPRYPVESAHHHTNSEGQR